MSYAVVFIVAAVSALLLTPLVRSLAVRLDAFDAPAARKVHERPVPRVGGVAVAVSALIALLVVSLTNRGGEAGFLQWAGGILPVVAGGVLVFAVGLWDDLRPVHASVKVIVQSVAAALVIGSGIAIDRVTILGTTYPLGALAATVTFVWVLGLTNAFNLLDGLDGLAAGLAVIASATCAIILAVRGHHAEALLLVALIGAGIGFLRYNSYPASIFLGDSGSLLFGFVLAVTAITGWQKGATTLALGVPLLIFAVPIVDTTMSIGRRFRLSDLARLFEPDRDHIHHRLMASMSHPRAVLVLYVLSFGFAALALLISER